MAFGIIRKILPGVIPFSCSAVSVRFGFTTGLICINGVVLASCPVTFTRRLQDLDAPGRCMHPHAEPVYKLPPILPPVRAWVDIYGDTARKPETGRTAGDGPVPEVQGTRYAGGEECGIGLSRSHSGVPPGIPFLHSIRIREGGLHSFPAPQHPARNGRTGWLSSGEGGEDRPALVQPAWHHPCLARRHGHALCRVGLPGHENEVTQIPAVFFRPAAR